MVLALQLQNVYKKQLFSCRNASAEQTSKELQWFGIDLFPIGMIKTKYLFSAWHGAIIETIVFLDVFEISGNLKSCQKVAIFKKYGTCIKRDRYVASFPDRLISNWNDEIPYAIITVKFSLTVRVFCWDNAIFPSEIPTFWFPWISIWCATCPFLQHF